MPVGRHLGRAEVEAARKGLRQWHRRRGPGDRRTPTHAEVEPAAGVDRRHRHRAGVDDRRGVFAAFAPAARAAGTGLLVGLAIAAVVAYCNATSSARLAARYPESGGTYVYGRERLGPFWGYLAGWGFVVGKTASCAAMALTFGAYAVPDADRWAARSRWPPWSRR